MLENLNDHMAILEDGAPPPPGRQWERSPVTGARRLGVDIELLCMLAQEGMTDHEIAKHLMCSRITVVRRRRELGIKKRAWTELSQEDLVEVSGTSAGLLTRAAHQSGPPTGDRTGRGSGHQGCSRSDGDQSLKTESA